MSDGVLPTDYLSLGPHAGLPRGASASPGAGPGEEGRVRAAAIRFEAAFLAEMLRHAGLAKTRSAFGGGAGEQAFSGSLVQEYAARIADSGGVGLADSIYRALLARESR